MNLAIAFGFVAMALSAVSLGLGFRRRDRSLMLFSLVVLVSSGAGTAAQEQWIPAQVSLVVQIVTIVAILTLMWRKKSTQQDRPH